MSNSVIQCSCPNNSSCAYCVAIAASIKEMLKKRSRFKLISSFKWTIKKQKISISNKRSLSSDSRYLDMTVKGSCIGRIVANKKILLGATF